MKETISSSAIRGMLDAPASKSYAQRAVAAALLAEGWSELQNMGLCDDTSAALDVAQKLGAAVEIDGATYRIRGGLRAPAEPLHIGESGLSTRLFSPIAALLDRPVTITGRGSILTRPITMIEQPLRDLGVKVQSHNGLLPVEVWGPLLGGEAEVDGSASSQFLSGLLMALPLAARDSILRVARLNSKPYIEMTLGVARAFGIEIRHDDFQTFFVQGNQSYTPTTYNIEGDWSGASCLLVAGAVAGEITVRNLNPASLQADRVIVDALRSAGAKVVITGNEVTVAKGNLRPFEFDATQCPDLFPALAALAANCPGTTTLKGTSRLANKESDRAKTLAEVLGQLGIAVDLTAPDVMRIAGGPIRGGEVSSHNDHRIAMAAAIAALTAQAPIVIQSPQAVQKSYPTFWKDLSSIQAR